MAWWLIRFLSKENNEKCAKECQSEVLYVNDSLEALHTVSWVIFLHSMSNHACQAETTKTTDWSHKGCYRSCTRSFIISKPSISYQTYGVENERVGHEEKLSA